MSRAMAGGLDRVVLLLAKVQLVRMPLKSVVRRSTSFLSELRERRVFRVAAAYLIIAFGALQVTDILAPALGLPDWTITLVLVLAIAGFALAVVLAWAYDVGPAGIQPAVSADVPSSSSVQTLTRSATITPCVAVIPFLNLSADSENEYFADGMTEDVIAALSKIRALRVISRTSVMQFKGTRRRLPEVAQALGARLVLEGSVIRENGSVLVKTRLVDPASDTKIWADAFTGQPADIVSLQQRIARAAGAAVERWAVRTAPAAAPAR